MNLSISVMHLPLHLQDTLGHGSLRVQMWA